MLKKIKIGEHIFKINNKGKSISYYCSKNINIHINKIIIKQLLKIYKKNNKTFRICLHTNNKQKLHCMIVVMGKKNKTKIHKHLSKTEYYYIHYGEMDLFIYDVKNNKYKKYSINSNSSIMSKIINNTYHQIAPKTRVVIFSEIRNGPFKKNDSIILKR